MSATGAGDPPQEGYKVLMPPDRYIPLPVHEIVDAMKSSVSHAERSMFNDVCQLMEGCAMTEFSALRRRVKKNFRFFAAAAMHRDLPTRKGRGIKKEESMDEMEMVFLKDFWDLMDAAHYTVLSEAEWLAVKQERLLLDMPIRIHWDDMDARLLHRFFTRHPEHATGAFRYRERVLLFHRGVGVIRQKGLFITQKVDLLVKYLVERPGKKAFYWLAQYLPRRVQERAAAMRQRDAEKDANPNSLATGDTAALEHKHSRTLTRVSLRLLLPSARAVFAKLHKQLEVVEPTYKDILLLYRNSVAPPSEKELAADPGAAHRFRRDQRGIVVKRFDEVPVADLEILFPDKEVGLKTLDLLTLYGTALGALIGGLMAFLGASIELSFILSTLSVVGGKLFQTYSQMQAKKSNLMKQMAKKVFDVSLDSQEGAIYSVLDDMADQLVKEQLLAYFLLLKNKYSMLEEELDALCESYLEDKFDVKIDFAIEESLPRLLRDGLVERSADAADERLHAATLEEAHARLLARWQRAFTYSDTADDSSLTDTILGSTPGLDRAVAGAGDLVSSVLPGRGARKKLRNLFHRRKS